jgi:bacillithiol synthase
MRGLYSHRPDPGGFRDAIEERKKFPTNRPLISEVFSELYKEGMNPKQKDNIASLSSPDTFTVCTAHQPNIFTGYLYFIYKIVHTIKLADELKTMFPECHFVPVYYMGSEDNDLAELGQVNLGGVKLVWKTNQTGAVGRMKVDKPFIELVNAIEGQLGVEPYGKELISVIRDSYKEGNTISESTFRLVNRLFAQYGLLVLQADNDKLKREMLPVFQDDLFFHKPYELVHKTGELLQEKYKVQVNPREINLFYILDDTRERITGNAASFSVEPLKLHFNKEQLLDELRNNPGRFSPNVVLRGLYQETILPNIAFIGGGAEIAYWLELKALFENYGVPFPVLVLRNSFLLATKDQEKKLLRMGISVESLFSPEFEMMNDYVVKHSQHSIDVESEKIQAGEMIENLKRKAAAVDQTLVQHIDAMHARLQKQIATAGKKLLRAEKRKFETETNQLRYIRESLFPDNSLQERVDNFMPWYAKQGPAFIENLYIQSPALDQQFGIIVCE